MKSKAMIIRWGIGVVLMMSAIVGAYFFWYKGSQNLEQKNEVAATDTTVSSDEPVRQNSVLKGKDFTAEIHFDQSQLGPVTDETDGQAHQEPAMGPMMQFLTVIMNDGSEIKTLVTGDGKELELATVTFGEQTFSLFPLFGSDQRELIGAEGQEWANEDGDLSTLTLYRIDGDKVREVISLITNRNRPQTSAQNTSGADQHFQASYNVQYTDKKEPYIVYDYNDNGKTGSIRFDWKDSHFVDESGEYKNIEKTYEN